MPIESMSIALGIEELFNNFSIFLITYLSKFQVVESRGEAGHNV